MSYKYAILLDNLNDNETSKQILEEILKKPQYDVTLFCLSKENIIPNPLAVFNIVDYFSWVGPTIITSYNTLEKALAYPAVGPKVIIGMLRYKDCITIPQFNLDVINTEINKIISNE